MISVPKLSVLTVDGELAIEVVCAMPEAQYRRALSVSRGTTVMAAALASGLKEVVPGLEIAADRLGIFGRKVPADRPVEQGDRVEIYRPLSIDPMQARRKRAHGAHGAS